jgi:VIT1/CCC1 family predicted Fe2+/Mn2+ transporter
MSIERGASRMYDDQPEAIRLRMPEDERSHARVFRYMAASGRGIQGGNVAKLEGRHRSIAGNALRAGVLGANDGLVSNLSLVMGVAGADLGSNSVVIAGVAGLVAGACSMAIGEWISVQSAREMYENQIRVEADELAEIPREEEEELALIYQAKGMPQGQARELAQRLLKDPSQALDTLAREELGVSPDELGGSPWQAAIASFLLFGFGALIPVLPFFFGSGAIAIVVSVALSCLALFGLGVSITVLTGRGAISSGLRQAAFGLTAAAVTFGIGTLLGVSLS